MPYKVETNKFPPLSRAPEADSVETELPPSSVLGQAWQEPSVFPPHLQSAEALIWLTGAVGRLVASKSCGREDRTHTLGVSMEGAHVHSYVLCYQSSDGGVAVTPSLYLPRT
jgi:hypothetical protein